MVFPDTAEYWNDVKIGCRRVHRSKSRVHRRAKGDTVACGAPIDLKEKPWRGTNNKTYVTCRACMMLAAELAKEL